MLLNIGGIANVSLLPADPLVTLSGFDTGPGNTLMDAWVRKNLSKSYDSNGAFASTGSSNEKLLRQLMSDPYFLMAAPKSTGREYFHIGWLENHLEKFI